MKPKSTATLLLLFFAGLAGLWWADRARVPTAAQRRQSSNRILPALRDARAGDIRRVEIEGAGPPLTFERRGARWRMTRPVDVPADSSRLDALVANLKSLPRSPDAGTMDGAPSVFGLDRPRVVRLFGADATRPVAALEVGKTIGDRRYVREPGQDEVELADARTLAVIDDAEHGWRERSLFAAPSLDIDALALVGGGRDLEATKVEGRWRIDRPIRAPGDEARFESIAADLSGLRVVEGPVGFIDDARDLAQYGLRPPAYTVRVGLASDPGLRPGVEIGKAVPGTPGRVYARRVDGRGVLVVDARGLDKLPTDVATLRGRNIADLAADRVDYVRVTAGGSTQVVAKGADGWRLLQPVAGKADREAVLHLISQLNATAILARLTTGRGGWGWTRPPRRSNSGRTAWPGPRPRPGRRRRRRSPSASAAATRSAASSRPAPRGTRPSTASPPRPSTSSQPGRSPTATGRSWPSTAPGSPRSAASARAGRSPWRPPTPRRGARNRRSTSGA